MKNTIKIIAEMAWAHDGDVEKAISIMRAAKEAGADAIGIHVTNVPEYMVPNYGNGKGKVSAGKEHFDIYEYLNRINLSNRDWKVFCEEATRSDIDLCVMPNDLSSLEYTLNELDPSLIVVTAASFIETDFICEVAKSNKTTIFRIGGASLGDIENTLNLFRANSKAEAVLLHGFQNYPTLLSETNIKQLEILKELFQTPVGLADHIDGSDPLAKTVPMLAVACGATYIEKHITWNRAEKGEDFEAALDPDDFFEFVENLRGAATALGTKQWMPISPAAASYRDISRKRIVAARNLVKGEILSKSDIVFKRSDFGASGEQLQFIIDHPVRKEIQKNQGITLEDIC